jgi:hypothetical protein
MNTLAMNRTLERIAAVTLVAMLGACAPQEQASEADAAPAVAAEPASPAGTAVSASPAALVENPAPAAENFARENPSGGAVERVTVTARGIGPTPTVAVDRAIRLAIEQVNGRSVDASSVTMQQGLTVAISDSSLDLASSGFAERVATHSRGAVTDFKVIQQPERAADGTYAVTIEANVAKFVLPATAKRLKLSIAPLRVAGTTFVVDGKRVAAGEIARQLRESLIETLTQTERFAILDRAFTAELDAELARVAEGRAAHQDISRIGQELSADYLLLARVDRFAYEHHERELRTSERRLVWHTGGGTLTLRLVNVATGQVEMAESIAVVLPGTEPTTLRTAIDADAITQELLRQISDATSGKVVGRLFPVTVVAVNGDQLVLSQGGKALTAGSRYKVALRGKEIKDPQTGQSLGRMEEHCCVIEVTQVLPQMSQAIVVSADKDLAAVFAPGALELRDEIKAPVVARPVRDDSDEGGEREAQPRKAAPKTDSNW